ncbi:MAG: plasmid partition protein ParG [Cyanobacteria bacterium J06636_27]
MPKHIPQGMAELSVYIDKELKTQFKMTCVAENKSMSEVIGDLVKQHVKSRTETSKKGKGAA